MNDADDLIDLTRLGALMANVRKEHNLTQKQLADKLNVSQVRISELENGRAGYPGINTVNSWCLAVGINPVVFAFKMLTATNFNTDFESLKNELTLVMNR